MTRDFYAFSNMGDYGSSGSEVYRVQASWLLDEIEEGPLVVDLGSGIGVESVLLGQKISAAEVVCIDLSTKAMMAARAQGVTAVRSDFSTSGIPLRNRSVDVVIMNEIIEHVANTDHLLREANRVLVDDGIMLLSTPNLAAWFNRLLLLIGIQPLFSEVSYEKIYGRPGSDVVGHLRLFTLNSLVSMLEDYGFAVSRAKGISFRALPWWMRGVDRVATIRCSLSADLVLMAKKVRHITVEF